MLAPSRDPAHRSFVLPPTAASRELRPLDALRGLAALLVAIFHLDMSDDFAWFSSATFLGASLHEFVRHGYLAVDLFLILSGYILARKYGAIRLGAPNVGPAYVDFLVKRFARVYPLYLVATLAVLAVFALEPVHNPDHWSSEIFVHPWRLIAANLALVQGWGVTTSLDAPAWTLSGECLAYVCFPAIATLLLSGGSRTMLAWFALTMAVVIALDVVPMPSSHVGYDWHDSDWPMILRIFAGFCLGVLAWRFEELRLLPRVVAHPATAPLAALALVWAMATPGHEWLIILAMAAALAAMTRASGRTLRVLNARPLFALGYLSFGVYLIHDQLHPARRALEAALAELTPAAHPIALGLTVALAYGLAAIAYRVIERPARARIIARWRSRRALQLA